MFINVSRLPQLRNEKVFDHVYTVHHFHFHFIDPTGALNIKRNFNTIYRRKSSHTRTYDGITQHRQRVPKQEYTHDEVLATQNLSILNCNHRINQERYTLPDDRYMFSETCRRNDDGQLAF
jgi:hypothetical protein